MPPKLRKKEDKGWKRAQKRLSGYQFFLREILDELKARYPDCSIVLSDVSRLSAGTWQNLPGPVRQRFQDEADRINKVNFKFEDKKGKKHVRVLGAKRPLSPFILYCKENRPKVKKETPGLTMGQISTVLSCMWACADETTKLKFKKISSKQRELYLKARKDAKELNESKEEQEAEEEDGEEESGLVENQMEVDGGGPESGQDGSGYLSTAN